MEINSTLTLELSHRLTATTTLHVFSSSGHDMVNALYPSQHIVIQLPDDLDPIAGVHNLSAEDRCLYFTPFQAVNASTGHHFSLFAKNGRVTGLLSLPRPTKPLSAQFVSCGGGFPREVLSGPDQLVCVAGGTGLAGFLAMQRTCHLRFAQPTLLYSIREDEIGLFEYVMKSDLLHTGDWQRIHVFVTSGPARPENQGRSWKKRIAALHLASNVDVDFRRMTADDIPGIGRADARVLYCGGGSLEWQIRLWALSGGARVFTTRI